jgi:hypothetical protein
MILAKTSILEHLARQTHQKGLIKAWGVLQADLFEYAQDSSELAMQIDCPQDLCVCDEG